MNKPNNIDLQALVDTHEQPFVIIDRDFNIVAVNSAYERANGMRRDRAIGGKCYQVSHHKERPCFELGEDCPHQHIYEEHESCSCLHIHHDDNGRIHRVRINAYPLKDASGELFLGEAIQELSAPDEPRKDELRMVGQSPQFVHTLQQLRIAAFSEAPVMLEGETGTGKDLAANYIHQHSSRSGKPFLTLDCTVLTESLFEAEVFGHERGAFTGSVGEKEGLFEIVDGGALFLDEVGELSPPLQAKLLRVLETGDFRRVGGRKTLHTDARIICATNRDIRRDVDDKSFREDLYYRVACLHIPIPSLRERMEDIPLLVEALLDRICASSGKVCELSADAMAELQAYSFPGNIRELRNILTAAVAHSPAGRIEKDQIAAVIRRMQERRSYSETEKDVRSLPAMNLRKREVACSPLHDLEAGHIASLLEQYGGNRRKVAAALKVSERTVYRKLKQFGLT